MRISLDTRLADDYRTFLRIKSLPVYKVTGRWVEFPDEYAAAVGLRSDQTIAADYEPWPGLFDYQRDISRLAIRKQKFAAFVGCGLGKTFIASEFARHALNVLPNDRCALMVAPLMVVQQTIDEVHRFYGGNLPIEYVPGNRIQAWLDGGDGRLGITNYESLRKGISPGRLGCLIPDESSMLKSHYGRYGTEIIRLGRGLHWKLALTGTPAPNDRIEYANHAVFLDQFPNVNSFLAKFFINRGETSARWELRPHALRPFYRALAHWAIFLSNPATYGWQDNVHTLPQIHVHIEDVELTDEQIDISQKSSGNLFPMNPGGIVGRRKFSQLAKGNFEGRSVETLKYDFIRRLVGQWESREQTIIWCRYDDEQDRIEAMFPTCASIRGATKTVDRHRMIEDFQNGRQQILVSKPRILGFGLNLQAASRHVFSGLEDSYEEYHQAVKRSNRVGSTKPLNVHIPVTDLERPLVDNVLRKAKLIQRDTEQQESIFRDERIA